MLTVFPEIFVPIYTSSDPRAYDNYIASVAELTSVPQALVAQPLLTEIRNLPFQSVRAGALTKRPIESWEIPARIQTTMRSLGTIPKNFSLPDLIVSPRLTPHGLPFSRNAGVRVPVRDRLPTMYARGQKCATLVVPELIMRPPGQYFFISRRNYSVPENAILNT